MKRRKRTLLATVLRVEQWRCPEMSAVVSDHRGIEARESQARCQHLQWKCSIVEFFHADVKKSASQSNLVIGQTESSCRDSIGIIHARYMLSWYSYAQGI